jgi:protein TonB
VNKWFFIGVQLIKWIMVILPAHLAAHFDSPQQASPSLPVSIMWSVFAHIVALAALLSWGLPTAPWSPTVDKQPLTLVEVSASNNAVAAVPQRVQQMPASLTALPKTNTSALANQPLANSTEIVTTAVLMPVPTITSPSDISTKITAPANTPSAVVAHASNPVIQATPVVSAAVSASTTAVQPTVQAVELPISNAAYLNNPPPQYPAQSRRLGEQGTVKWRVLIGTDGKASQPELVQSSGFPRLDEAAKQAVLAWRYVPGKRGGVAEVMRYVVPLRFE